MNRIAVSAIALALSAVTAGVAVAGYQDYGRGSDSRYDSRYDESVSRNDVATVIRVDPVYDRYANYGYERQECWNERTRDYDDGYYRDSNGRLYQSGRDSNVNGTVIGALIGGALGNQAGQGDGRKAATIGGAVVGGLIGNKMDRDNNAYEYRDNSGTVRRCRTVYDDGGNQQVDGYNVTYRYAGQTYRAYSRTRPGRTMRVVVDVRPLDNDYRR